MLGFSENNSSKNIYAHNFRPNQERLQKNATLKVLLQESNLRPCDSGVVLEPAELQS